MAAVLVVDDERPDRRLMRRALEGSGHEVRTVATGVNALTAAASGRYDLIILDPELPDMNGVDVLDRLLRVVPSPPVLVVSAVPTIEDEVAVLDTGTCDFLAKPFAVPEFLARVRARLRDDPGGPDARTLSSPPSGDASRLRQAAVSSVGAAVDRLREAPGSVAVDAVLDQARAALVALGRDPIAPALDALVDTVQACQRVGRSSSAALESSFRTAAAVAASLPAVDRGTRRG